MTRLPTYFISHGGGPWPWMPQARQTVYAKLAAAEAQHELGLGRPLAELLQETSEKYGL